MNSAAGIGTATTRKQVVAWSLWDWGSAAYNAVTVAFVFSVYLTDAVGKDLPGSISASTWLAWAMGLAGFCVAVLAPITGQMFDALARRKLALGILTSATVLVLAAMFFVRNDYHYLWLGLLLLGLAAIVAELAQVPYYAMLRQVSTPDNVGRVSGFGWAMGYLGGIVLLLGCYFGFIAGDGDRRGLLDISTEGGLNIRVVMVVCAVWFAVFAIPLFVAVPEVPPLDARASGATGDDTGASGATGDDARASGATGDDTVPGAARARLSGSYRVLWRDVRELWDVDRRTVYFLIASAIFRDGLTGVFTFGAVLAVNVYGISAADVLLFGVAANVVAAIGALVAGGLDDRFGPRPVIVGSLVAMLAVGAVLVVVSGPLMFWIFGLLLCLFVGPSQSSARAFLTRIAPVGREGQMFGLYATTGRAVSFLSPMAFGFFAWWFGADRAGIVGLLLVLAAGLVAMRWVGDPVDTALAVHSRTPSRDPHPE